MYSRIVLFLISAFFISGSTFANDTVVSVESDVQIESLYPKSNVTIGECRDACGLEGYRWYGWVANRGDSDHSKGSCSCY